MHRCTIKVLSQAYSFAVGLLPLTKITNGLQALGLKPGTVANCEPCTGSFCDLLALTKSSNFNSTLKMINCSTYLALFLLLIACPFSDATFASCRQESLKVAFKSSDYVLKVKTASVAKSNTTSTADIKVLYVWKPCKTSFKSLILTAKVGHCGFNLKPSTTYLFAGNLLYGMSGAVEHVTITECNFAKVFSKVDAAELKLLPALKKALKCRLT